ncbi:MAG: SUF system NifU family Fe-S cluster assembly protein [Firmicutes bacterium]|nr:SUF system NifU family Fe-S cluster assembly protein [Bacillota bacterium]
MSGLEDLYREIVLDHYRAPRNKGTLDAPPAFKAEGFNPLCGDEVIVYLAVENDIISDIKIAGQGCSISQSSASMMSEAIKGKSLQQAEDLISYFKQMMSIHESQLDNTQNVKAGEDPVSDENSVDLDNIEELAALQGVVKFPVRIKCATLAWNTLAQCLDEAK